MEWSFCRSDGKNALEERTVDILQEGWWIHIIRLETHWNKDHLFVLFVHCLAHWGPSLWLVLLRTMVLQIINNGNSNNALRAWKMWMEFGEGRIDVLMYVCGNWWILGKLMVVEENCGATHFMIYVNISQAICWAHVGSYQFLVSNSWGEKKKESGSYATKRADLPSGVLLLVWPMRVLPPIYM